MPARGAVATGHPLTSAAAEEILREGGNAFDAIIAAHFTACVVEPVLASLGGGGYLLAEPAGSAARVYDFFAQTPRRKSGGELDFYPISADFGPATQEFHIGRASIATPGAVAGMFAIHRDLASLPMTRLVEPARRAAREGVALNAMQAYILDVVSPIYLAGPCSRALFEHPDQAGQVRGEGDTLVQPELADTLEALAREGEALFYRGEIAAGTAQFCRRGGLLQRADLEHFQVEVRPPLTTTYRGAELLINPPPSSGGTLIAFMLALLEQLSDPADSRDPALLAAVMDATNRARADTLSGRVASLAQLLAPTELQARMAEVAEHPLCSRGTTHLSVVDAAGNLAAMTVSNGEGCGELLPGTGIMLNNMLGEEDINPGGFFQWAPDTRMTSMMAPAILHTARGRAVLGSGGSNRLRSAILQVIINLVDRGMEIEEAVAAPRIHLEGQVLNLEPGVTPPEWPGAESSSQPAAHGGAPGNIRQWPSRNLFFGGVHSVWTDQSGDLHAVGDERRGGCGRVIR